MDVMTMLLIIGLVGLGFCVIRFGMAMKDLEQRVSDLQDRLDRKSTA